MLLQAKFYKKMFMQILPDKIRGSQDRYIDLSCFRHYIECQLNGKSKQKP